MHLSYGESLVFHQVSRMSWTKQLLCSPKPKVAFISVKEVKGQESLARLNLKSPHRLQKDHAIVSPGTLCLLTGHSPSQAQGQCAPELPGHIFRERLIVS